MATAAATNQRQNPNGDDVTMTDVEQKVKKKSPEKVKRQLSWRAMTELKDMRDQGQLCDATLCAGETGERFDVHRAVLSAMSPFFRALFTGGFAEHRHALLTILRGTAAQIFGTFGPSPVRPREAGLCLAPDALDWEGLCFLC